MIYTQDQLRIDWIRIQIDFHTMVRLTEWSIKCGFSLQYNEIINARKNETPAKYIIEAPGELVAKITYDILNDQWYFSFWGESSKFLFNQTKPDVLSLENVKITRIDVAYDRICDDIEYKLPNIQNFFDQCKYHCNEHGIHCQIVDDMMKIHNRFNAYHLRVYKKPDNKILRFELEIKRSGLQKLNRDEFNKDEFQKYVEKKLLTCTKKCLILNSSYTDWVRDLYRIRQFSKNKNQNTKIFVSGYMKDTFQLNNFNPQDINQTYYYFALISFLRQLNQEKFHDNGEHFYTTKFLLTEFFEYLSGTGTDVKKNSKLQENQRAKATRIFKSLANNGLMTSQIISILDDDYKILSVMPLFRIFKKQNVWYMEIMVSKALISYEFKFASKNLFKYPINQSETLIWVFVMVTFLQETQHKRLDLTHILNYKNLNTTTKRLRAALIVKQLNELFEQKLITNKIKLHYRQTSQYFRNQKSPDPELKPEIALNDLKETDLLNLHILEFYEIFED